MFLDPQDGLYVFEVSLGFSADGEKQYTTPYLVQADDIEEAEEKVLGYIDGLDLEQDVWIEELSEPYEAEKYSQIIEDGEIEPFSLLEEVTEEEFRDLVGY